MILGMALSTFTLFYVILSLIGIFAGAVVVAGMLGSRPLNGWVFGMVLAAVYRIAVRAPRR